MTKSHSSLRTPIKYKGIHEPKGRVKGFRVEIRPPGSSTKIWVGTFDKRLKAMRAFDAAVYLTGKDPYYFHYPENYFPPRTPKPSKEEVQKQAKIYADKEDPVTPNPVSSLVDPPKASSGQALKPLGLGTMTMIPPDLKAVPEKKYTPQSLAEMDEFLQNADTSDLPIPVELSHPDGLYLGTDWILNELSLVDESKPANWESKSADWEDAAFHKGFSSTQDSSWIDFPDLMVAPSEFPPIQDGGFFSFVPSAKTSSKRKRDVSEGANDRKKDLFSEAVPADAAVPPLVEENNFFPTMWSAYDSHKPIFWCSPHEPTTPVIPCVWGSR